MESSPLSTLSLKRFTQRPQSFSSFYRVMGADTKARYYPQSRKGYVGGQTKSADQRITHLVNALFDSPLAFLAGSANSRHNK